ncbi:MAG TPA: hypothetical protein VGH29_01180, partial [Candidatus Binataceae bacterium]
MESATRLKHRGDARGIYANFEHKKKSQGPRAVAGARSALRLNNVSDKVTSGFPWKKDVLDS